MLEFFRTYQRFFFLIVTTVIIFSFTFFGTFSTFSDNEVLPKDRIVTKAVDGSKLSLSKIQNLSRFLAADRSDTGLPNLFNDGVIRYDLLRTGLADLLVEAYFEPVKGELGARLERAKKFRPYAHPQVPFLSAVAIWDQVMPSIHQEMKALQAETEVSLSTFSRLSNLYQQQSYFSPEILRKFLLSQSQRLQGVPQDPRLQREDLSLFGFHSLADWFGKDFVDLASEFILNGARVAEEKGFTVSFDEAKGDLLRNFQRSMQILKENQVEVDFTYQDHLRMLGFDERRAVECWREVLLFRRYFQTMGDAVLLDRLPYQEFAAYARETLLVNEYKFSPALCLGSFRDLVEFETYLSQIAPEREELLSLPTKFYSLEEMEARCPELVEMAFTAKVAETTKEKVALLASLKEVWDFQLEDTNWQELRKKFSHLPNLAERSARFDFLEKMDPSKRAEIDQFTRLTLASRHPEWVEIALASQQLPEKKIFVSKKGLSLPGIKEVEKFTALLEGNSPELLQYSAEGGRIYRIENVEKIKEAHILTFEEAKRRGVIARLTEKSLEKAHAKLKEKFPGPFSDVWEGVALHVHEKCVKALEALKSSKEENRDRIASVRLLVPAREALSSLQVDFEESPWLKPTGNPIADQFKLISIEKEIHAFEQENTMQEDVFVMVPKEWSPIHVPEDGEISFCYLKEKKEENREPILEQLVLGKEILSQDARRYLAERLLESTKRKVSIVIPVQTEELL